ncbi:MAG: hypothetical protein AAF919_02340 [Pseudomonadota bacterium]
MLKGAVLYAKSLKKLRQFYLAIGGRQTDDSDDEYVAIATASGAELIILQVPEEIAQQIVIETPPAIRGATPLKPIIEVSSIDDALKAVAQFDGRPVPGAQRWTFRDYAVQDIVDPEGNVIQLWQHS